MKRPTTARRQWRTDGKRDGRLIADHYYVIGGSYADQPACAYCRRFRADHYPDPPATQVDQVAR